MAAEASREIRAYFPGVADDADFCTSCVAYGHRAGQCPAKTCRFCGDASGQHTPYGCSKAAATAAAACVICGSTGHRLGDCPQIWCTYTPAAHDGRPRRVQALPVFCYFCGEAGHYGGDCSANHGEHLSGRHYTLVDDIWSARYSRQFIDEASPALALASRPFLGATSSAAALASRLPAAAIPLRPVKPEKERQDGHAAKNPASGNVGNTKSAGVTDKPKSTPAKNGGAKPHPAKGGKSTADPAASKNGRKRGPQADGGQTEQKRPKKKANAKKPANATANGQASQAGQNNQAGQNSQTKPGAQAGQAKTSKMNGQSEPARKSRNRRPRRDKKASEGQTLDAN